MLIDWFTVAAQAVNFLILIWLLKRFLYRPILKAMEEREKGVAGRLMEAETQTALAEKEREKFRRQSDELERRKAALLQEAETQATVQRQNLFASVRKDAEASRSKWQESLLAEQEALQHELADRVQHEVFAVSRKTLSDLASSGIEERMVEIFVKRLREMDGGTKQRLATSMKTIADGVVVRSVFQLSQAMQTEIQQSIFEMLAAKAPVHYETAPDLICGIEAEFGGEKVAWNISDYLKTLERSVEGLIAGQEATHVRKA